MRAVTLPLPCATFRYLENPGDDTAPRWQNCFYILPLVAGAPLLNTYMAMSS